MFLETLLDTAPSLFVHLDTAGRILNHNAAALDASGLAESGDLLRRFFWDVFIDPAEREDVIGRFEESAPDHAADEYENAFTNARGEERVVFWRSAPVSATGGRATGIIATGIDITERKHRELELQRERDATTMVLEATPATIVVLARDGTIRDRDSGNPRAAVNRSFRDLLGWRDEQILGRSFLDLVAPGGEAAAREAIEIAAAGGTSPTLESAWLRWDGGMVTFSWTASPVVDVTGRTDGLVLVSAVDVTERRAREIEAERRRNYINDLTEAIPSYLLIVHPDATISHDSVNPAFERAFGWTSAEMAGRRFVGDLTPGDDDAARLLISRAAGGETLGEIESRWAKSDGDHRIVAWTARLITGWNGEQLVLVAGADVTMRRIHEQEVRASRTRLVQAADEARQQLERNLHDGAQQRLVALAVSLRLAESRLATDPDAAARLVVGAREELSQALEELRELARGIHPAMLTDRGLEAALEGLVQRTPIPVELEFTAPRLPTGVEAAAYYVIAESLTNAAKHAGATGVRVSVVEAGDCVRVEVSDDGCGGVDTSNGTGLRGLADRVAALDGTMRVTSPPGHGTRVVAEIPLSREPSLVDSAP